MRRLGGYTPDVVSSAGQRGNKPTRVPSRERTPPVSSYPSGGLIPWELLLLLLLLPLLLLLQLQLV